MRVQLLEKETLRNSWYNIHNSFDPESGTMELQLVGITQNTHTP